MRRQLSRVLRLAAIVALAVLAFLAVALVPDWLRVFFPPWLGRRIGIRILLVVQVVYAATVLAAPIAVIVLGILVVRRRRRGRGALWPARLLVLTGTWLLGAALLEGAVSVWHWTRSFELPWLPSRFPDPPGDRDVDVLVIGESSAQGVPYQVWFSVGDIVAWKLGEALPQRRFRVENQARPGLTLQAMHGLLAHVGRRPELVILYAGHNEFQSRYDWAHGAFHYADETPPVRQTVAMVARRVSPVCRAIQDGIEVLRVSIPPPHIVTRRLVDVPVYTPEEYAARLHDFRTRLAVMVGYLEWLGARVVLVIPPGNEAGFDPNRSFLPATATKSDRAEFAAEFEQARALEGRDPPAAIRAYRVLLARQPGFAETHYRLARLLERSGEWAEAAEHDRAALDLDGLPMRLPSDFQDAYREVAAKHTAAILIDGPAVLRAQALHGLIGDFFFTDGLHPSLNGYTALAQAILSELHARGSFGWPADRAAPVVDPADCAHHFGMDAKRWNEVCEYSAWFYTRTAFIRHDPAARVEKAHRYQRAAERIAAGASPDSVAIPGVGPGPAWSRRKEPDRAE